MKIDRLLAWWRAFNQKPTIRNSDVSLTTPTVAESTREAEVKKSVRRQIEAQAVQMQDRALVPHECADPLSCTKRDCFKFEPDRIVEVTTVKSTKGRYRKITKRSHLE